MVGTSTISNWYRSSGSESLPRMMQPEWIHVDLAKPETWQLSGAGKVGDDGPVCVLLLALDTPVGPESDEPLCYPVLCTHTEILEEGASIT